MTSSWRALSRRLKGSMVSRSVVTRVLAAVGGAQHPEPAGERLEGGRPVLLGAEQQPDQVVGRGGHAVSFLAVRRNGAGGGRAGGATTASRGRCRGPTRRARGESPCAATDLRRRGWRAAPGSATPRRPLPHHEQHRDPRAHPLEVVAVHVRDVGRGVGEVGRVAELAPPVPRRRVVVAGQPDGQRRDVGALQGEVHRVVRAERDPDRDDLLARRPPGRAPRAAPPRTATRCRPRRAGPAPRWGGRCRTTTTRRASRRRTGSSGRRRRGAARRRACRCARRRGPTRPRTGRAAPAAPTTRGGPPRGRRRGRAPAGARWWSPCDPTLPVGIRPRNHEPRRYPQTRRRTSVRPGSSASRQAV